MRTLLVEFVKYVLKMVTFWHNCDELFEIVYKNPKFVLLVVHQAALAARCVRRLRACGLCAIPLLRRVTREHAATSLSARLQRAGGVGLVLRLRAVFCSRVSAVFHFSIGSAVSSAFRLVRCNPPSALVSMWRVLLRQQTPRQLQRTRHRQHQQSAQPRHHLQWNTTWTWSSAWMR